jgi:hypothetical protein
MSSWSASGFVVAFWQYVWFIQMMNGLASRIFAPNSRFKPSYHLYLMCNWKLGLDTFHVHILASADMF